MLTISHVRKNDIVQIISGKEKGKSGKILRVLSDKGKVVVEKLNQVKKHSRPTKKNPQGGIITIEKPISASNVLLLCSKCNNGVRTGWKESKGKKVRVCKKCETILDKN